MATLRRRGWRRRELGYLLLTLLLTVIIIRTGITTVSFQPLDPNLAPEPLGNCTFDPAPPRPSLIVLRGGRDVQIQELAI